MKLKFTWGRILAIIIAVLLLPFVAGVVFPGQYSTEQTARRSFTIDENFTKVRKIMVRTNAAKEIVTMGGDSEFVEQHWEQVNADAGEERIGRALLRSVLSNDPDWELNLRGTLKVRTLSDTVGHEVVTLHQEVKIVPDQIESRVKLKRGTERLLVYTTNTDLARAEDQTQVSLELTQKIKLDIPWFAHRIADRRVLAAAEQSLANQEQAMRRLIEENADKAGIFPLR